MVGARGRRAGPGEGEVPPSGDGEGWWELSDMAVVPAGRYRWGRGEAMYRLPCCGSKLDVANAGLLIYAVTE